MLREIIAESLVDEWKLANGWSPALIAQEWYAHQLRTAKFASEAEYREMVEARTLVAGATVEFVNDIAEAVGASVGSVLDLLKNSHVVKLFSAIRWSFDRLSDLLKKGYQEFKHLKGLIKDFALEIGVRGSRWTTEQLDKLDSLIKNHPKAMRISGIALGSLMLFVWFNQAFTGDADYDFDLSEVTDALSGRYSLSDIFGGENGMMMLTTLAMGAGGMSYPWPGAAELQFIAAIIVTLAKKIGTRLKKAKILVSEFQKSVYSVL